jgi:D-glycero-alpha-D-manno-heptose 1-phosphate guanylyltransferase
VKAFVLAGGLGTRLRPQFGELPKSLAPLGGRPFLVRQLEWLAAHGVREAVILAGYGARALREAVGDGARFGMAVEWSIEAEPLGTGGALAQARALVRGPALVVNGDTLADCDPWKLEERRWRRGAWGTLALYRVDDAASRGRVEVGPDGRIARFVEKDAAYRGAAWVNGGVYAFAPWLWRRLPHSGAGSLERDVLPALAAEGKLEGLELPGKFWDIGTPEEWARAEDHFASR